MIINASKLSHLSIDDCEYLTCGTIKLVYRSEQWPNALIKIIRPELVDVHGQFAHQSRVKRLHAMGVYRAFAREIIQYLALCRRAYSTQNYHFPVAAPLGFIQTDRGLALVSESILDEKGNLAPSLHCLIKSGNFNSEHAEALDAFFEACSNLHIVFGEVNSSGILFTTIRSGKPEFVLVDGIGEKNLIPLKSLSRQLNQRHIQTVKERISAKKLSAGSNIADQSHI